MGIQAQAAIGFVELPLKLSTCQQALISSAHPLARTEGLLHLAGLVNKPKMACGFLELNLEFSDVGKPHLTLSLDEISLTSVWDHDRFMLHFYTKNIGNYNSRRQSSRP